MSKEMEFFIYLVERYAEFKKITASDVLKIWDQNFLEDGTTVTEYVQERYYIYHLEVIENAFKDIDHVLLTGKMLY